MGNVKVDDGVFDILFSVVVNNVVRGAYGAALLLAEYHTFIRAHPQYADRVVVQSAARAADDGGPDTPSGRQVVKYDEAPRVAPVPTAQTNPLTSSALHAAAAAACADDLGAQTSPLLAPFPSAHSRYKSRPSVM